MKNQKKIKLDKHMHMLLIFLVSTILSLLIIYCIHANVLSVFNPVEFNPVSISDSSTSNKAPDSIETDDTVSLTRQTLEALYNSNQNYVHCNLSTLYYTGYDNTSYNKITGHYYYSLDNNTCTLYLLSTDLISKYKETPKIINNISFDARLIKNDANYKSLLRYMSTDLDWNYFSLSKCTNSIVVDESGFTKIPSCILIVSILLLTIIDILLLTSLKKGFSVKKRF